MAAASIEGAVFVHLDEQKTASREAWRGVAWEARRLYLFA
jgi:hypothetical protein